MPSRTERMLKMAKTLAKKEEEENQEEELEFVTKYKKNEKKKSSSTKKNEKSKSSTTTKESRKVDLTQSDSEEEDLPSKKKQKIEKGKSTTNDKSLKVSPSSSRALKAIQNAESSPSNRKGFSVVETQSIQEEYRDHSTPTYSPSITSSPSLVSPKKSLPPPLISPTKANSSPSALKKGTKSRNSNPKNVRFEEEKPQDSGKKNRVKKEKSEPDQSNNQLDATKIPEEFLRLAEIFSFVETCFGVLEDKGRVCTLKRISDSVSATCKWNLSVKDLQRIKTIYPESYGFQWYKSDLVVKRIPEPSDIIEDGLTTKIASSSEPKRRRIFKSNLRAYIASSLEKHPEDEIPDIEEFSLPPK
eukprot:TRINITY_DN5920_c0_g1_i3.p2 TRINITY_DN5920_c0_g1~~TRINITY_DN5920_c0_g1_i3.p2  ORF type:complete len:358 (-),score=133.69 TRINITY_DN5920_c0_g1_i3:1608-2681(-)